MWVRFTDSYNWKPRPSVTIAYKAGMTQNVTTACGLRAIAAGKATRLYKRGKNAEPTNASSQT